MSRAGRIAGLPLVCSLLVGSSLACSLVVGSSLVYSLAITTPAHAQQRSFTSQPPAAALPLELQWQAPAECPSADDVRAQLERSARVRPGFNLTPLSARAQVTRGESSGADYTVKLQTRHDGQDGEREVRAADCATLVRTVTLVLALAFGEGIEVDADTRGEVAGASATAGADGNGPATAASAQSAVSSTDKPAPATGQADERSDDERSDDERSDDGSAAPAWALLAGGGVQFGLLPSAAFAASAGAELSIHSWSVELRASGWPGVSARVAQDVQAHFNGVAGAVQGCARLPVSSLMLALCAGARAAALHGRSEGATEDGSTTAPWYAVSAATSATFPRGHTFGIRIEAALAASLNRPLFVIDNLAQAHRVPLLVPDLSALLVIAL